MSRISVIGAGYVGLVTGAGLAWLGHSVVLLESDRTRLARLANGHVPIHEPGLAELLANARDDGRLEFAGDYAAVIPSSDYAFLAVNTPAGPDGEADTRHVFAAVRMLLEHARPGLTVVTKSTVPVGTGDEIERLVLEAGLDGIEVVSNPEFLREGTAVDDFLHPDRIVVGTARPATAEAVAGLYEGLDAAVFVTSRRSAELAKYAANALLATRISFMNEIASISETVGADVEEVARVVGADSRIGPKFLQAGLGWGGSCFPKDLTALAATAARSGRKAAILEAVIEVNARQRERAVELLLDATGGRDGATVGVLGLAFKPHTDDLRGSPALAIIGRLLEDGVRVRAHDPQAMAHASLLLPTVTLSDEPYDVAEGADALLLATEWPEYLQLDWTRIRRAMRGRLLLDGRNVLHPTHLRALGFEYRSFGRADDRPAGRPQAAGETEPSRPGPSHPHPTSTPATRRTSSSADRVA